MSRGQPGYGGQPGRLLQDGLERSTPERRGAPRRGTETGSRQGSAEGECGRGSAGAWWSRRESNPRPPECHSGTLPTELRPHASAEATPPDSECQSTSCSWPEIGWRVGYAGSSAGVAELVYAGDSKSPGHMAMRVRVPPPAPVGPTENARGPMHGPEARSPEA